MGHQEVSDTPDEFKSQVASALAAPLGDALKAPESHLRDLRALAESLADQVAQCLAADRDRGWLVYAGAVRQVEIADRFGPSSWEITTDEHPQDRQSWGRPS